MYTTPQTWPQVLRFMSLLHTAAVNQASCAPAADIYRLLVQQEFAGLLVPY